MFDVTDTERARCNHFISYLLQLDAFLDKLVSILCTSNAVIILVLLDRCMVFKYLCIKSCMSDVHLACLL